MPLDEPESIRDNRRRRIAQFRNNWGTVLHQIDEEDRSEDILDRPICPARRSLSSYFSSTSPEYITRHEWIRKSSDLRTPRIPRMLKFTSALINPAAWHYYTLYPPEEAFCNCNQHNYLKEVCKCAERDDFTLDWVWDPLIESKSTFLSNDDRDVLFHKNYSYGTACVRGNKAMNCGQHFWEIKLTSPVYGTNMMIGVGTSDKDLNKYENVFTSMIGEDYESWGFSYKGVIHHNGEFRAYSPRYCQGSLIGVHLDLWFGRLSFYRNRQPLGVAFEGLRGKTLFPLASSTAARSGMRILRSSSLESSLQFLCSRKLRELVPKDKHVLDVLHFPPGLCNCLRRKFDWVFEPSEGLVKSKDKRKKVGKRELSSLAPIIDFQAGEASESKRRRSARVAIKNLN